MKLNRPYRIVGTPDVICANCQWSMAWHCGVHLVPCCPGKCPGVPDDEADPDLTDLGDCPYFARYMSFEGHDPLATCAYSCVYEPECVTCEPRGGWPSLLGGGK